MKRIDPCTPLLLLHQLQSTELGSWRLESHNDPDFAKKNASNASDSGPLWSTIGTNNKSNQLATKTSRCILRSKHLNQDPSCSFLIFHLHGHHDFFVWKLDWTMGRHTVWGDKIENGWSNKKVWLAWLCVQTTEGRKEGWVKLKRDTSIADIV